MPRRYAIPAAILAAYFAFLAGMWLARRDPSGLLLVQPTTRYAGEGIAVDYEAARGFVVGAPLR